MASKEKRELRNKKTLGFAGRVGSRLFSFGLNFLKLSFRIHINSRKASVIDSSTTSRSPTGNRCSQEGAGMPVHSEGEEGSRDDGLGSRRHRMQKNPSV